MRSLFLLAALSAAPAALAVPLQLNHQGRLDDSSGVPLEGQHTLTVTVYDQVAGGAALWTDTVNANFEGGVYSIILGADGSNPLPADVFNGSVRYVSLAVNDGAELPQRLVLTSVPYAMRAGVAARVEGGIVDASELRIGGTTVIGTDGQVRAPLSYNDLIDVPADADTLGGLACATGQIAQWNGLDWACANQAPATIDANTLNGTIRITNLPVGGGADQVAAGDHAHSFGQITGVAAIGQLPTGTDSTSVALGDHSHNFSAITGSVGFAQLPTGTSSSTVAIGDHGHAFSAITGTAVVSQLPIGTSSTTVARGDHTHDAGAIVSGTVAIGRLPTGTTATTVALGNHLHDDRYLRLTSISAAQATTLTGGGDASALHTHAAQPNPWFACGNLSNFSGCQIPAYPLTRYEYGISYNATEPVPMICTNWNRGARIYNREPYWVYSDNPTSGIEWGGTSWYRGTDASDDNCPTGEWRHRYWSLDANNRPVLRGGNGCSAQPVMCRERR